MSDDAGGPRRETGAVSPYRAVLGDELDRLHPRLRPYFEAIPPTAHGFGRGVFDTVGTPRRWLWPALWVAARTGVAFPVWERDVAFTVVNRPVVSADGQPAVAAERTFGLRSGERTMVDEIGVVAGAIVDRLGRPERIVARFEARVVDGGLRLSSTAVGVRFGRVRIRIPRFAAPRVELSERFDAERDVQRVSIVVEVPLIGRLYEYAGDFRYEIRTGERTA